MKSNTLVLFHEPEWIFSDRNEVVKYFTNPDGTETEGTAYFPRNPIILETNDRPFTKIVPAVFTTIDELIKSPPNFLADEIQKKGDNISVDDVVSILDAFAFRTSTRFHYTLFEDGVLVYSESI